MAPFEESVRHDGVMVAEGAADPHGLRFCDLGPLVLHLGGVERPVGGRRAAAALALLLMNSNRWVSADALRESIWGEAAGDHAASTLETHMFRLRRLVEPSRRSGESPSVVISEPGGYRLLAAPDQVDSVRFGLLAADVAELLRTGQPERARSKSEEALKLWRGRPFDAVADEVWAAAAVARTEELRNQLQESHVEALLACGAPDQALQELEPMLAEHPLRERLWRHRMLAAYRCGRTDEALDTYQKARHHLLEELGVEPGPELRDLQAAVLAGDEQQLGHRPDKASTAGPVNLPRKVGTLFGRQDELTRVRELCATQSAITITGAGGCGKTRLAVEAARDLSSIFVDGIWFVDLTTVQADDQVADAVVSVLGLAPGMAGQPNDLLRNFVRDRRMLLILDNCEHVLDGAAELVAEVRTPGSELTVLATSREPLQIEEEIVVGLGPLPVPILDDDAPNAVQDPVEAATNPAVQLFLERASLGHSNTAVLGEADSSAQLRAETPVPAPANTLALVAQICRSVDGVPLAVELAAARAAAFSLEEIARQVAGDPTELRQVRRGAPAHQQSLGLAVEWSHRMLTATEQQVHRRVSIIHGPFTTAGAADVCGLSVGETEGVLVGLVHKSMLVPLGSMRRGGKSRFAQLATIRAHGQRELVSRHEEDAAERSRDQWVTSLIAAKPPTGHRDERHWFNEVEDNFASVRSTLHTTLRKRRDPVGAFVVGRLMLFWYFRGLVPEGGRWYVQARDVPNTPALDQALVTLGLAAERGLAQRMDVARPLIEEGLRIGADRLSEDDVIFGEALVQLAGGVMLAGEQTLAADLARRALWIAEQHDDAPLALTARARLAMNPHDIAADSAPEIYQQAVQHENHYAAYLAANGATVRALATGDIAAGLTWSDRIIELNRRSDIGQAPVVLEIRANLLTLAGRPEEALQLYSAARFHNRHAGLPWPSRDITTNLLARATDQVDRTQFEDAWQSGRTLTLADITPLTSEQTNDSLPDAGKPVHT